MQPDGGLLGGRYELTALLATGGMGQVWQARDTVLNRDVAVKVLRSEYTGDPTFRARFRAEAQLAAGLAHPNIATLFDYGEVPPAGPRDEHIAYLVMELVRGESLSDLLRREKRLSPDRALDVLRQSAAGLAAAHAAGVVHRDVKPGNVLLAADGQVKLTDFGVAVSTASVSLTRTGEVVGTAAYLSPEQVNGNRATPASDVYALGLVGYECLAGRRAFNGESAVQVALSHVRVSAPPLPADVPEPVRRLIDRAITKDPAERFPDGAALRDAIDQVRAGGPVAGPVPAAPRTAVLPTVTATSPRIATPPPPFPPTRVLTLPPADEAGTRADDDEPARRRRWPVLLAALFVLLVVGGGTFGVLQLAGDDSDTGTGATPTTSAAPTTTTPQVQLVSLVAADYVGRPVTDAEADLAGQGFTVQLRSVETADVPDGQVMLLDPAGRVPPGSTITLTYAVAPPPPPPPTPTPTAEPTPTDEDQGSDESPSETSSSDEDGDKSKGKKKKDDDD